MIIQQTEPKNKDLQPDEISVTSSKHNEESSLYYTKNKKIIFWLCLFVLAIFIISQATLVSYNWKNYEDFSLSDSYFLANQIVTEWQRGFISDVIVSASSDCPNGYDHAFNFSWPGTSFGCFCQVDVNSSFVIEGYCSPKLIQASCRNIPSQQSISASIWRNSSNICIKRSSVSFYTEQKYNGNNKICGSSKSLTIVPQSEPCPFVNATFAIPSLEDHYSLFSDSSSLLPSFYGTFNSTSPYSFYSYPISKFTVSEYQFCLIDEDSGLSPSHVQFVLLNQKRGCSSQGSYQTLDSINEIEFYANNPQLDNLSNINGFPKPTNDMYLLGFASLPSWTYNCRHNYDSKFSIVKAVQILNFQFFKSYYYVALVQILVYSVLGFQLFILTIRRLLKRQVYPVGYRQMYLPKDFCFALMRYVIDWICKFIVLGLMIYSAVVIFINWNWFKSSLNLQCADNNQLLITQVMQPYRDMYQKSLYYVVAQLVVFLVVFIIDFVHFVYIYRNDLRFYLVDSYNKVLVQHTAKDELDWIDKQGDKKLIDIQNLDKNVNDAASEKFRVTMAMNVFDNERGLDQQPSRGKVVKKKKKKFGAFKKDYENIDLKNDDSNPFTLDGDPSILGLNSIDNLSGQAREPENEGEDFPRSRKNQDRARRKKK